MKTKFFTTLVATLALVIGVGAFAALPKTQERVVAINDAFIPSGFDSGSEAFVVINGLFQNGCYRLKDTKVDHVGPMLHDVRAYAMVTEGMCLAVLVPFSKEVQLGKLAVGEHAIHFQNGDGTFWEKRLTIEE